MRLSSPDRFDNPFQEETAMTVSVYADPLPSPPWHPGPLASHIDWFAGRLAEQGYAPFTAQEKLRLGTHLSQWLQEHHVGAEALDELCIGQFLQYRQQQGRAPRHLRLTLQTFLHELRDAGMLPVPVWQQSALDVLVQAFDDYLPSVRGLARSTREHYLPIVRRFLQERFGTGPLVLHALGLHAMTPFLLRQATTVRPRHAQSIVSALRTFCRFLVQRGDMSADLAAALPAVADGRLATVPKTMTPAQVTQLLQSCTQDHPTGQRDYTVLLLMARLGLRTGEVVAMTLDALDWETGTRLVRGKGGRRDRLPLPQDVGQAVVTYLSAVRPRCAARRVFLRMQAPQCGFANSVAVCTIVRRALERAGLELPCKGAHLLRHSLATISCMPGHPWRPSVTFCGTAAPRRPRSMPRSIRPL
jgi:site-specific recombinase XerD